MTLERKFHRHILKRDDGCWEWTSQRNQAGYGQIREGKGAISAHRAAWEIYRGKIPWGMCVLHKCDRPWCVNPDHLYVGDHKDNTRDMIERGRMVKAGARCGPKSRVRKLTDDQVRAIRKDDRSPALVAMDHGISAHYASEIMRGKAKALVSD